MSVLSRLENEEMQRNAVLAVSRPLSIRMMIVVMCVCGRSTDAPFYRDLNTIAQRVPEVRLIRNLVASP
jgi:hypothetical protein